MRQYKLTIGGPFSSTTMPIQLTDEEANVLQDIQAYCEKKETQDWLEVELWDTRAVSDGK